MSNHVNSAKSLSVWLVGSGPMAAHYASVLEQCPAAVTVIGRGEQSAARFSETVGLPVASGGVAKYLEDGNASLPDAAIVAVGVDALAPVTELLLNAGVRRILVEKPAGLHAADIRALRDLAAQKQASVYVAYNRRFYSSVRTAREMIAEDGGVSSFSFEFTEWSHQIAALPTPAAIKERWMLANSTHVIDLAFYLGGEPGTLHALHAGSLPWHPAGCVFAGAGTTRDGVLFNYQANWAAPGRWGVEVSTSKRRFIFRPMEELQVMRTGSVAIDRVELSGSDADKTFKPGLMLQTRAFLFGENATELCTLDQHTQRLPVYLRIAGYDE